MCGHSPIFSLPESLDSVTPSLESRESCSFVPVEVVQTVNEKILYEEARSVERDEVTPLDTSGVDGRVKDGLGLYRRPLNSSVDT